MLISPDVKIWPVTPGLILNCISRSLQGYHILYTISNIMLDSLKSGNITGQYQMSPELSRKIGTFDNDRGTNDIAQGHLIVTSQYQLSQRDVLRTFDID